jgi:enoyl-CoA hydratase/carnithine racemase
VAHVVLNRPERRNALTGPLADELAETIEALNGDDEVSVLVVRGAGGAFCSGLDLKEFAANPPPAWVPEFGGKWQRVHRALFNSEKIIVGALERAAVNGGAALALACDFLIAGESAFLQVGEVQQGMPAPMNMAWLRLRHTEAVAARLALLGDRVHGPELLRLGVAFDCVPDDGVVAAADELTDRLATHDPSGVRRIKVSLRRTVVTDTAEEWFARPLTADPLAGVRLQPRSAENR